MIRRASAGGAIIPGMPLNSSVLTAFLSELHANNNKEWFEAHRAEYQLLRTQFTDLVQDVLAGLARVDPQMAHVKPEQGIFRINRDVRFSADKSPYKTQFSASLSPLGRKIESPGYYLQLNHLGELMIGGGMYMPIPDQLAAIRGYIVAKPQKLTTVLASPAFVKLFPKGIEGEQLKRPPKGFDETAPHLDHLKRKSFIVSRAVRLSETATVSKNVLPTIATGFAAMTPFIDWLRAAMAD